jgi:serine protease Do
MKTTLSCAGLYQTVKPAQFVFSVSIACCIPSQQFKDFCILFDRTTGIEFSCQTILNIFFCKRSIQATRNSMKTFKPLLSIILATTCLMFGNSFATAKESSQALELAKQLNQAFIEVADKVSPAVVVVEVTEKESARESNLDDLLRQLPPELRRRFGNPDGQPRGNGRSRRSERPTGRGSGIVITTDGYILTNNHVVEDAEKITVRFKDSKSFTATVKGRDPSSDLAVIKIDAHGLVPAKMGDSDATRVGEFAIAVGAPFALDYSVTIGHVSAKGRSVIGGTEGAELDQDFIQTDASINPGNSGGPLVNLYGEVIGINSMIAGMNTGIGFAIPSNLAKRVMAHLIQEGKFTRSRIGVEIFGLREDRDYKPSVPGIEDGVVVRGIASDGPAAKSDLKAGDIIVGVDGKPVKTARELKDEIAYKKVGQVVTLDVARVDASRKVRNLKIKIKTDAFPTEDENGTSKQNKENNAEPTNFGLTVRPLTKELADEYGVAAASGVLVTAVESGSVAEENEIKAGDVITEINRTPISNMKQFRDAMNAANPKRGVVINFVNKSGQRLAVLKEE